MRGSSSVWLPFGAFLHILLGFMFICTANIISSITYLCVVFDGPQCNIVRPPSQEQGHKSALMERTLAPSLCRSDRRIEVVVMVTVALLPEG